MTRLLLTVALLIISCSAAAETWPSAQWSERPTTRNEAVSALESYAFPARDETTRKGVRTDALLIVRDGRIVYERYGGVTRADTPHLT